MSDLEHRLRDAVEGRSQAFEPSPDLPERIVARVEARRRTRRLAVGAAVGVAAAVAVVVVALAGVTGREESQWSTDGRPPDAGVPEPDPGPKEPGSPTSAGGGASTTTPTTTSTTAVTPAAPDGASPIGPSTPLSRAGIGPVTAGMTLRTAQEATGMTITPVGTAGGDCVDARVGEDDLAVMLVVEPPADPGADPLDGVVRAVSGSVVESEDGAMVGQTRAELLATLGQPTRTVDVSSVYGGGAEVLVFESGGFAYGAFLSAETVIGLTSGDPAWVDDPDGCSM